MVEHAYLVVVGQAGVSSDGCVEKVEMVDRLVSSGRIVVHTEEVPVQV